MPRIMLALTRLVDRPLHREYVHNLSKGRFTPDWSTLSNDTDRIMYRHGQVETQAEKDLVRNTDWADCNLIGGTNGKIPPLVYSIIAGAIQAGYEYLVLLDDDAKFRFPGDAIEKMRKGLESSKSAAQTGPMGEFAKYKHYTYYGQEPELLNPMDHNPWTTLGCQAYRVSALKAIKDKGMLDQLNCMEFRADSYIAMALHIAWYSIHEQDIPGFVHALHSGQNSAEKTVGFHHAMIDRGQWDWVQYREMFDKYAPDKVGFYMGELRKLIRAHEGHHRKKIAKLEGK